VDSTCINGRWNVHLAAATTLDGHNWMYPIAFGFIDGEPKDNWIWFMTQLRKVLGNIDKLAICTDACKGLSACECSCLERQHTGRPCQHPLVVITSFRNEKIENYVHSYYSMDMFRKAYSNIIYPLRDKSQWPQVESDHEVRAPLGKRGVGRQRKLRIKSCLEGGRKSKSASKGDQPAKTVKRGPTKCKRCGELGHI
jgi:hypothetical protein